MQFCPLPGSAEVTLVTILIVEKWSKIPVFRAGFYFVGAVGLNLKVLYGVGSQGRLESVGSEGLRGVHAICVILMPDPDPPLKIIWVKLMIGSGPIVAPPPGDFFWWDRV